MQALAEDFTLQALPARVPGIVRAAGVSADNELAWSWDESEPKVELEKEGVEGGEVSTNWLQPVPAQPRRWNR